MAAYTWDRTAGLIVDLLTTVVARPRESTQAVAGEGGTVAVTDVGAPRARLDAVVARMARNPNIRATVAPLGSRREQWARQVYGAIRAR